MAYTRFDLKNQQNTGAVSLLAQMTQSDEAFLCAVGNVFFAFAQQFISSSLALSIVGATVSMVFLSCQDVLGSSNFCGTVY